MKLLLDTHALLSLLFADGKLSRRAREAIELSDSSPVVSAVSVWEIAVKRAIGKLEAPSDLLEQLDGWDVELLPISIRHAHATGELPLHHRDPFDRLLVAQAQLEGCALVTRDRALGIYDVPTVW